ncbi:site-specific integrase [Acinetobacter sp. BY484]|uniref:site-specific integrase n=1 Tax=Acinetobacter sp. BY484 TaxID=2820674 RepID=UPI001C218763|nr:site-specific integrase [Acinetobacter sp. BY484]
MARQKDMKRAQSFIQIHLPLDALDKAYQSNQHVALLEKLEDDIEREAASVRYKKMIYHCYRKQITLFNQNYSLELELPTRQFISIERDQMVFDRGWLQRSKHAYHLHQKLWRYWHTATEFSEEEVIGNVLLSSILFAGISSPNTLDAFFEQLQEGLTIHRIPTLDLHLVFLEPLSSHYGDLYHPEAPLRKSRTLVLDRITQLWLSRFLKQSPSLQKPASAYLHMVLSKMELSGQSTEISKLFACASAHWMQLQHVSLDPALMRCLEETNESCGLSLDAFQHFMKPTLLSQAPLQSKALAIKVPSQRTDRSTPLMLDQEAIASIKRLHKYLLKTIRTNQHCLDELINYVELAHQQANLSESAIRICLWLISLFQPSTAQVQQLSQHFDLDAKAWLKYLRYQQKLRQSSIYSYYAKFAEAWLFHSYAYAEDPDFNSHLEDIYSKMMEEKQKSSAQKLDLLRRFHHFQKVLFQSEDFPVFDDVHAASHPKTHIISAQTFCAVLALLPTYMHGSHFSPHDMNTFSVIFTLAFRTGMRIKEILGLRVKDIEGPACTSLWIRPYRYKQQQHHLKTDSAERNLPVSILLKPDEYQAWQDYCISKRISSHQNDSLFSLWNSEEHLSAHLVSQTFSHLIYSILPSARYSFHSLRHSATNYLALVLNMPYRMVKVFTDYTEEDYCRIRGHLIRSSTAQDLWYRLAHLLGHITPKETFKSYIHLAFIMAGYKLSQYDPAIPYNTIKTIDPDLGLRSTAKEMRLSDLTAQLRQRLSPEKIQAQRAIQKSRKNKKSKMPRHDLCNEKCYPGTEKSSLSMPMAIKLIRHCERFDDIDYIHKRLNLPVNLIQQCKTNISKLQSLKNQKGKSRFVLDANHSGRILPVLETFEEKRLMFIFCKQLSDYSKDNQNLIKALNIFIYKSNTTESGLIFFLKDMDQLEIFLTVFYPLFPREYWACEYPNSFQDKDLAQFPWIHKFQKKNLIFGKFKKSFRIYLKSQKSNKSLCFLKYIIIILCVFNFGIFKS